MIRKSSDEEEPEPLTGSGISRCRQLDINKTLRIKSLLNYNDNHDFKVLLLRCEGQTGPTMFTDFSDSKSYFRLMIKKGN